MATIIIFHRVRLFKMGTHTLIPDPRVGRFQLQAFILLSIQGKNGSTFVKNVPPSPQFLTRPKLTMPTWNQGLSEKSLTNIGPPESPWQVSTPEI